MIDIGKLNLCILASNCWQQKTCKHAVLHKVDDTCGGRGCSNKIGEKPKFVSCVRYEKIEFKQGDHVYFINNIHGYKIGESNPLVGTRWECQGNIRSVQGGINVQWDNGSENGYEPSDLIHSFLLKSYLGLSKTIDPNFLFRQQRRKFRRI